MLNVLVDGINGNCFDKLINVMPKWMRRNDIKAGVVDVFTVEMSRDTEAHIVRKCLQDK